MTLDSGNMLQQGEGVVPPSRRRRRLGRQWRGLETNDNLQIRNQVARQFSRIYQQVKIVTETLAKEFSHVD